MKHILKYLLFIPVLLPSCKDPDDPTVKDCGEEVITLTNFYDCNGLYNSDTTLTDGTNTSAYSFTIGLSGSIRFITLAGSYESFCTYESPLVSAFLEFALDDPNFTDTVRVQEAGGTQINYPTDDLGTIHKSDQFYVWENENPDGARLIYNYSVYFPTLGSWSADSAYFFSNLVQMRVGANGARRD